MFRFRHEGSSATAARRWTLPNGLTFVRIALVPVFLFCSLGERHVAAFTLFCVAAATDLLDGLLARALDQRTVLGSLLDPFADKLLALAALVALTWTGPLSPLLLALSIARDLAVLGVAGSGWLRRREVDVVPTRVSKYATLFSFSAILLALLWRIDPAPWIRAGLAGAAVVACQLLAVATLQYLARLRPTVRKELD